MGTLTYVSDEDPGISRRKRGRGFSYSLADGAPVKDWETLERIAGLAIPPAWRDVWICLDPQGHLQATGLDDRGRKQYRYHPAWEEERRTLKYDSLADFGRALPRIRRRVRRDLQRELPCPEGLLAAMVSLIDKTRIRIGKRRYVRENRTYGAATLLKNHVDLPEDGVVRLRFRGKGGTVEDYELRDRVLFEALDELTEIPGRELFSWKDEAGEICRIETGRLNAYLSEIAGVATSAKMFRTWGGSVAAFEAVLAALRKDEAVRVKAICDAAASVLHNTPAVCRASYVHPAVLSLAGEDRERIEASLARAGSARGRSGLLAAEARFLAFLDEMA
ncbi:DNA topoisomerase IB [Stappia sp. WLB 29]|uniref:DNA topoisomerase IB n=1 Tax=Stappia sp. WLB 29 TaxID=2925220 RepID=UPI0020BEE00D|nr:DNA topoisomerase IB [Stappia sp. WLB 29]